MIKSYDSERVLLRISEDKNNGFFSAVLKVYSPEWKCSCKENECPLNLSPEDSFDRCPNGALEMECFFETEFLCKNKETSLHQKITQIKPLVIAKAKGINSEIPKLEKQFQNILAKIQNEAHA